MFDGNPARQLNKAIRHLPEFFEQFWVISSSPSFPAPTSTILKTKYCYSSPGKCSFAVELESKLLSVFCAFDFLRNSPFAFCSSFSTKSDSSVRGMSWRCENVPLFRHGSRAVDIKYAPPDLRGRDHLEWVCCRWIHVCKWRRCALIPLSQIGTM